MRLDYETLGASCGVGGALWLALALPSSRWGWVLFLGSNCFWLLFALHRGYRKLAWQTLVFSFTSLLGIANGFYPGNGFQVWVTALFTA